MPFYATHHAWPVYLVAGWQDCKDPSRVAFHPFKTDAWPWKRVEPCGREWIVKFLDWPQLISHTKPSLPKQEPSNASRLKAFFHLKAHDGVMAVVLILWSMSMLSSKRLTHVRWFVNIDVRTFRRRFLNQAFETNPRRPLEAKVADHEICQRSSERVAEFASLK